MLLKTVYIINILAFYVLTVFVGMIVLGLHLNKCIVLHKLKYV